MDSEYKTKNKEYMNLTEKKTQKPETHLSTGPSKVLFE